MLVPLFATMSKILAALPGFPTMLAPVSVIIAASFTSATDLTTLPG